VHAEVITAYSNLSEPGRPPAGPPAQPQWDFVRGAVLVERMLPGGHGSADPGSGMNRAPERLSLAVVVLVVLVSVAGSQRTTWCASLQDLEKQCQERPRADGRGRISALTGDRQLRLP